MRTPLMLVLAAALTAGCSAERPRATAAQAAARDPAVRGQALIDSGNAAQRRGDYATAAKRFASAAVLVPDDPVAFYGLGMALAKLGRDEDARVAYAKSRELAHKRAPQAPAPAAPAPR